VSPLLSRHAAILVGEYRQRKRITQDWAPREAMMPTTPHIERYFTAVDFMIKFELGMIEPDPSRARNSALTIALSYVAGGLVPAPYVLLRSVQAALIGSVIVTLPALFVFGFIKGQRRLTG
jgi:hypothetical protein